MPRHTLVTVAPRTKLLTKTTFSNYDICLNPYVGCEFKCQYCYVRFFIKDKNKDWGDFVRLREHIETDLPKELRAGFVRVPNGKKRVQNDDGTFLTDADGKYVSRMEYVNRPINESRLVLGTMTDPYQPKEVKYRLTRTALKILADGQYPQFKKVGLFTRSPLVLQDIDLLKKLPDVRVHVTVSPYSDELTRALEPLTPPASRRWEIAKALMDNGIRVHVSVAPIMPLISEDQIESWVKTLSELAPAEYFVDPMQPYKESMAAFELACKTAGLEWEKISKIMLDKLAYAKWKKAYYERWQEVRKKYEHLCPKTLPIWSDHEQSVWIDMRTGKRMKNSHYGDEE
jgi:DNA repair photolyase